MPRRNSPVKPKRPKTSGVRLARSLGAIDIHFHGAFGIDLMSAPPAELDELAARLWQGGVAGFCPTTLSTPPDELASAVARLGAWIEASRKNQNRTRSALPLGIHLEGPFINSSCCGAHPPGMIRKLDFAELERLWKISRKTLKILTLAPETLNEADLRQVCQWAKSRKVSLSLGHSKATEAQAKGAFKAGFRGITHAWNALSFHHRSPGSLGAALGNRDAYVEVILDQVHVAPTLIEWTQKLHPADRLAFISDCVPAAETSGGKTFSFGPLTIRYADGACRLPEGALAGGGKLLSRSFCEWIERCADRPASFKAALRSALPSITNAPLWALQIPGGQLRGREVQWTLTSENRLQVSPVDSA